MGQGLKALSWSSTYPARPKTASKQINRSESRPAWAPCCDHAGLRSCAPPRRRHARRLGRERAWLRRCAKPAVSGTVALSDLSALQLLTVV